MAQTLADKQRNGGIFTGLTKAGAPTDGVNAQFEVGLTGATGGTWQMQMLDSNGDPVTDPASGLSYHATAAQVQAACDAAFGSGEVAVSGGPAMTSTLYVVAQGPITGGTDCSLNATDIDLTGDAPAVTVATGTAGVQGDYRGAPTGSVLTDTTNRNIYSNSGTPQTPAWTAYPIG